ncbi:MAG: HEAT repeat domain-containing protein [Planctomycetota bacterium]
MPETNTTRVGRAWLTLGLNMTAFVAAAALVGCASPEALSGASASAAGSADEVMTSTVMSGAEVSRQDLRKLAIDRLRQAAASNDAELRAHTMEALSSSPAVGEPFFAAGLRDENAAVRTVAAMVVGRTGLRSQVAAVEPLLSDPSPYVRSAAIYAMQSLGRDNVDPTPLATTLIESPDPRLVAHAAFLLGELGNPSAVSMLRAASARPMTSAPRPTVAIMRLQIAEALAKLGVAEEVQTLHAALYPSSPNELERAVLAAQALGELGNRNSLPDLVNLVANVDVENRPIPESELMPPELRLTAAEAAGKLGRRDGGWVAMEYLDPGHRASGRSDVRALAARTLGEMRGPGVRRSLAMLLTDQSLRVQVAAGAASLRYLEGPR